MRSKTLKEEASLRRGTTVQVSEAPWGGVLGLLRQFQNTSLWENEWRKPFYFRNGANSRRAKTPKSNGSLAGVTSS